MRRTPFAVLTAFLLTLFVAVVPAVPAHAQGDERITAYNVNATLDRDGDARVTLDLTYDFADADRHGPYLTFVTRQSLTDNPGHVRHVTYSDIHASSPSGAPANLHKENGGALQLRIGSKDQTVTGTQKYRITYMVHGLIGRDNKESHLDEINWRIFTNVDVPVDNSKVTITAPANVTKVYCEVEDGECDTSSTGTKTVTFSARKIDANKTWRVVAGVPAGTFTSAADATVTEATSGSRADLPQYLTVIPYVVAVVVLGLIGLEASLFRKRDMEFADEAPGFIPAPDLQQVRRRRGKVEAPILVHPPAGITPAQAGALLNGNADTNTVTAGMLDLVARHHLSINQEEPSGLVFKKPEWRFNWLRGEDSLAPWEARLLGSLIGSGNSITTRELRRQNGNIALPNAKKDLDELNDQAGYFTKSHRQARLGIVAIGVAPDHPRHTRVRLRIPLPSRRRKRHCLLRPDLRHVRGRHPLPRPVPESPTTSQRSGHRGNRSGAGDSATTWLPSRRSRSRSRRTSTSSRPTFLEPRPSASSTAGSPCSNGSRLRDAGPPTRCGTRCTATATDITTTSPSPRPSTT
ncbi:MAG: DUF2207 domain-containing protein [Cutibacterium avidum]|nr:DUF2207 domain-containing protein [Cutibacterium avidum]MDU3283108.1 DUF2207 domain-containing protein [Cutibacterium avidum]